MTSKVYYSKEITPEKVVESRNGIHTVEAAAELGFGSREYELIEM